MVIIIHFLYINFFFDWSYIIIIMIIIFYLSFMIHDDKIKMIKKDEDEDYDGMENSGW